MNEIIAVIVGAVVIGFIAYLYKSRQGNRIIVKRISETPQIKISDMVRKNLKITYNDQPVDNLVLNNLVIYNNGNEIIEPAIMLVVLLIVALVYLIKDWVSDLVH